MFIQQREIMKVIRVPYISIKGSDNDNWPRSPEDVEASECLFCYFCFFMCKKHHCIKPKT